MRCRNMPGMIDLVQMPSFRVAKIQTFSYWDEVACVIFFLLVLSVFDCQCAVVECFLFGVWTVDRFSSGLSVLIGRIFF